MKEQADLAPIADKYTEYKNTRQNIEDSLETCWRHENDEEMRELSKEELAESKDNLENIENELMILTYS